VKFIRNAAWFAFCAFIGAMVIRIGQLMYAAHGPGPFIVIGGAVGIGLMGAIITAIIESR
jgi:hypothetical protein